MASALTQKEYLKKYLSGRSKDTKKKKKKRIKGAGIQIIDDDADISRIRPLQDSELELLLEDEDAPQVAGIIDERPEEVRKAEEFKSMSKWKVINEDDGFNSRVRIEEIKSRINRPSNEDDSDASPPRKQTENNDSDQSPIRSKNHTSNRHESNSRDRDSDLSPPRLNSKWKTSRQSDSDLSPPRSRSSQQIQQKTSKQSDSDTSPLRKSRRKDSPDNSRKRNSERDQSPVRKRSNNAVNRKKTPDSDASPPRKNSTNKTERRRKESRWGKADVDVPQMAEKNRSPPRNSKTYESRNRNYESKNYERDRIRRKSSSDPSPPRRAVLRDRSPERGYDRRKNQRNSESPPPSNKKMDKTLEGKQAGLQNAKELLEENRRLKEREEDIFKKMSGDVSGRYAEVASRKTGKKRESSVDKEKKREEQEKQKARDEKYSKWGKGVKQTEEQESRVTEYLHESSKPLARYKDDRDLDSLLRDREREGDPMLAYMREKKGEQGGKDEKPTYKGSYPANRFNLRPGYRWDGVDRSSGYEKTYFETQSKKKANDADAYKWSVEEM